MANAQQGEQHITIFCEGLKTLPAFLGAYAVGLASDAKLLQIKEQ